MRASAAISRGPIRSPVAGDWEEPRVILECVFGVEPLNIGEQANVRLKLVQGGALVLASVNQDWHRTSKRDVGEARRRILDELAAGERQRPNQPVAEEVVKHRSASARRVKADLLLGLDHGNAGMF